jgi:hypothetical protein
MSLNADEFVNEPVSHRDWTQYDIVAETEKTHSGSGFFESLSDTCDWAFGGLDYDPGVWEFPMGDLTVDQILDFFGEHNSRPSIRWHNEHGPAAYIEIADDHLADLFKSQFGIAPLTPDEAEWASDQDVAQVRRSP